MSRAVPASQVEQEYVAESPSAASLSCEPQCSSLEASAIRRALPADAGVCEDCRFETLDPTSRRFRYPFTSCPHCGPGYTILHEAPFSREHSSMAMFTMCVACRGETEDRGNRRYRFDLNSCPECGPSLRALTPRGDDLGSVDAVQLAARALRAQLILAVKGIGGFHLACDATSSVAVARLRDRKRRSAHPFSVMVRNIEEAERIAVLSDEEKQLLSSVERPVVLVSIRTGSPLAGEVAPGNPLVGLLLPYTPLHHLLLAETGRPLVMTSARTAGEPTSFSNGHAVRTLGRVADLFLVHDREIVARNDDSVTRVIAGSPVVLRRGRGYVPESIRTRQPLSAAILGLGANRKAAVCLGVGNRAWLSPPVGDLDNNEAIFAYESTIARCWRMLNVQPDLLVHDLKPDYYSTRFAVEQDLIPSVGVQHHHAHAVACMAEHGLSEPVLSVVWDATGYGTDGTSWGGEVALASPDSFERIATLRPIQLAGEHTATRQVWRIALDLLDDAFGGEPPLHAIPLFRNMPRRGISAVRRILDQPDQVIRSRGVGFYMDAVAAIVLGRPDSAWDGQLALEWDAIAESGEKGLYPIVIRDGIVPWEIDMRPMVKSAIYDMFAGRTAAVISARFHNTLIAATAEVVRAAAIRTGALPLILAGDSFERCRAAEQFIDLLGEQHKVYFPQRVPAGDGGIALGQVIVGDARLRKGLISGRPGSAEPAEADRKEQLCV